MIAKNLNHGVLVSLYRKDPVAKAIFDLFNQNDFERQENPTSVDLLKRELLFAGHDFPATSLCAFLEKIDSLGFGVFTSRIPQSNSKIVWNETPRTLARYAMAKENGEIYGVEAISEETSLAPKKENEVQTATSSSDVGLELEGDDIETFYFPFRASENLVVGIRSDMTARELENLSRFILVIAASKCSGSKTSLIS
jgi:hypothetical protein